MIFFDEPADQAGIEVTINDERLTSVVGDSYKWGEGFGEVVEAMIQSDDVLRYRNARTFERTIRREYIANRYLNLEFAPLFSPEPVQIVMTGSRTSDAAAADRELARRHGGLPDHDEYTWHHKEGIIRRGGRWLCDMYLVESGYHRRHPHKGGVTEYEFQMSTKYT